jgi:copper chaperone
MKMEERPGGAMEQSIRLKIDGMHCDGCVRRVRQALNAAGAVRIDSVEVGSAAVTIDPARVSPEAIAAAVTKLGFTARVEDAPAEG